jgi:hypothetical protein
MCFSPLRRKTSELEGEEEYNYVAFAGIEVLIHKTSLRANPTVCKHNI